MSMLIHAYSSIFGNQAESNKALWSKATLTELYPHACMHVWLVYGHVRQIIPITLPVVLLPNGVHVVACHAVLYLADHVLHTHTHT